ncbi:hypothetical protein, partial [Bacteriovorax sp. BSW11_IV]|uniref:hypothetical protein n=1 Tax=Bacteriovorax sp. BSW11_IV TaxID=1353529 RepID=UPI0012DE3DB2
MSQALGNGISDEKYLACANIGYIGSDIEACLFSNASVEKINLCGAIGYDNAGGVNRCINSNATIEKIQACRSIGFG